MALSSARSRAAPTVAALLIAILLSFPYLTALDASAAGASTEYLLGVVYDERGEPLAGALVWCSLSQDTVRTDAQGRFAMNGTALDGTGTLLVSAVGYLSTEVEFTLKDGGTLVRSFYLVERELDHVGDVEGHVTSVEGVPVEGARVQLTTVGAELIAFTDTEGMYWFHGVPVTEEGWTITVEARGFDPAVASVAVLPDRTQRVDITLDYEGDLAVVVGHIRDSRGLPLPGAVVTIAGTRGMWATDLNGAFRISVERFDGARNLTVNLRGYATRTSPVEMSGEGMVSVDLTLLSDGLGGVETLWALVTEMTTDAPLEGATVSIEGREDAWTTDARGLVIIIADGIDGPLWVSAHKDGCTRSTAAVELEDGGSGSVSLTIVAGSNAASLEGVVVDALTGMPIPQVRVVMEGAGMERATVTAEDGAFLLHTLPPGIVVTVTASAEGYVAATAELVPREYEPNVLVVKLHPETVSLVDVDVIITDASSGEAVPSAHVTIWGQGFRRMGRTDGDGELHLQAVPVGGGRLLFLLQHQHYAAQSGERPAGVHVRTVLIEAALTPMVPAQTAITGRVQDPDGLSVGGASVALMFAQSKWETMADDDGGFELLLGMDLDFTAMLSVSARDHITRNVTVDLLAHEVNWANFTLPLGPTIGNVLGTVVVEGSLRPIAGAEVLLARVGAFPVRTTTDDAGAFAFQAVSVVEEGYTLSVVADGMSGASIDVLVLPGSSGHHRVVMRELVPTTETVRGSVVSTSGIPLPGAVVQVVPFGPTTTGPDGGFELTDPLLEGERTLIASAPGFRQASVLLRVDPGATVQLTVVLEDAHADFAIVRGVVADGDGEPIGGAVVQLGWPTAGGFPMQTLTVRDGTYTFLGVPTADGEATVVATAEGFHPDTKVVKVLPGQVVEARLRLDHVELSPPEPMMSSRERTAVGVGAGAAVAALGALLATEVGRVALMGLFLLPMYTKIKREKMMDHFVRGRIYEHICNNPGVNFSAIKVRFNLTNGTVTYHLSMLERQEFIRSKHDGIYKRYFKVGTAPGTIEQEPMSIQGAILKLIAERPGLTQKEIARALGTSKQLISYYVRNMREEHLVETHRSGRHVRVYPGPARPS